MQTTVRLDETAQKIFVFEEVYPARAAREQAEKKKLHAFGRMARFGILNRPQEETVELMKWELRYEPFWHVAAQREVDYLHQTTYSVPVDDVHALSVELGGAAFEVSRAMGRGRIELPVREHCHRKIHVESFEDGLKRGIKASTLKGYVERYRAKEQDTMDREDAVVNLIPPVAIIQLTQAQLTTEAIDAHEITHDDITFEKAHLYYHPVFAFEYLWTAADKRGVIEIDGLTGEVVENGQWIGDKIDAAFTRETLFDLGAEMAGLGIPILGPVAVRTAERIVKQKRDASG